MYSLVDRLWRSAKRAADITRKITPHWLRHFFASAGLSKGVLVIRQTEIALPLEFDARVTAA